jgi:two-component system, sensor histidine kinase and response regulator
VDDNATNRRILGEMLSNWRLDPTLVDGAPAALAALEGARRAAKPFHLLLLDAQMPGMDGYALARKVKAEQKAKTPAMILLTSAGLREPSQARRVGIHATLLKPVKQSDLLDTIVTTLGRSVPQGRPVVRPSVARKTARPLHVLLVEDNRVNQKMATRILEKRGHRVTMVENGRQALDEIEQSPASGIDVVLMDVQMPVMNGLEATTHIRARERGGLARLPIVAMTAHAMRGDRERCLEAGMDAYLVKPIQADEMIAAIESFSSGGDVAVEAPAKERAGAARGARAALLDHLQGDRELAAELAAIFLDDWPAMAAKVEQALAQGDAEDLRMAAHTLKGAVGNFGAAAAAGAALRLEKIGVSGVIDGAAGVWAEVRREVGVLERVLRSLVVPAPRAARKVAPRKMVKRSRKSR